MLMLPKRAVALKLRFLANCDDHCFSLLKRIARRDNPVSKSNFGLFAFAIKGKLQRYSMNISPDMTKVTEGIAVRFIFYQIIAETI